MNMNNINLVTDETNTVSDLLKKKNIIQNTDIDTHIDKMEQGIIFDLSHLEVLDTSGATQLLEILNQYQY